MRVKHGKQFVLLMIPIIIIVCSSIYVYTRWLNKKNQFSFDIPAETKYIITYTSGRDVKEESILNCMDQNGVLLKQLSLGSVTDLNCIEDTNGDHINLFTHERIYFDDEKILENKEMETIYNFASNSGNDTVYSSGYVAKLGMFYKQVPHGLAYKIKEYGFFDLLVLYNENQVYNVRIAEGGSIAIDNETGNIYHFYGDEGDEIGVEKIFFDVDKNMFMSQSEKVDISVFFHDKQLSSDVYLISKTLIVDSTIYQVINYGENNEKVYIMEYSFDKNTIQYDNAYEIDLDGGYLELNTMTSLTDDYIRYYSEVYPDKIITFYYKDKTVTYAPFMDAGEEEGVNPFLKRELHGNSYVLKSDTDHSRYDIYCIGEDNNFECVVHGKLPDSVFYKNFWIADFYIIQ